jgi:hypothetical protein
MSRALTAVATVASFASIIPGPQQPFVQAFAMIASIGATLTQKRPPVQGNVSQVNIAANAPMPYVMGRTYVGGTLIHDVGYGGTVSDVPNPYRSMVLVWSGGGPVEAIEAFQADFDTVPFSGAAATGYYAGFMWLDTQLGATPEGSALAGPHGAIPQWGAAYKLSGYAAGLPTLKFDKKGKVFASGVPQFGAIIQGVLAYDFRLDPARPGGSGSHDFADEATWEYSESPALHGVTYARGRYQGDNDRKVIGCGFGEDQFDWPAWIAFANVCDANSWKVGGAIFEGPGQSKWDNLKRILACAAAEPMFVGGLLSVRFNAPKTALDTITAADLADGDCVVPAMRTWRERKNGIIPRYRSEANKWEYVQSALVSAPEYVTADGEEKNEERQYDLVQEKDQAAQLAAYELVNGREISGIVLPCKPRLIEYRPGEALEVDIEELGLVERLCVITGRQLDPATGIVTLTLETETSAKHEYALDQTGTAPPAAVITTGEDADAISGVNSNRQVAVEVVPIRTYPADYAGAVAAGLLPDIISPRVAINGADVKLDDNVHYSIATSGVTATVENVDGQADKGDIEITALTSNDGYVDLTVEVDGVSYPAKRIVTRKDIGLVSSFGGSGAKIASDNSFVALNSTSYTAISDVVTVTLAGGESLYGTAPLDYIPATGGSQVTRTATAKWEYSPAGAGTWTQFAAGIAGTASRSADAGEPEYGHGDFTHAKSGLAAGDYDVRLVALLDATGRNVTFTGTAIVEAKV